MPSTTSVPNWSKIYNTVAKIAKWWYKRETLKARKWGIRPWVDLSMVEYVTHDYFFSNEKLLKTGFKNKFPTVYDVVRDSVRWYIDNGWFDN